MGYLYMHPLTNVVQVTKLPNDYNKNKTHDRHHQISYHNRGWTFMENCFASLAKYSSYTVVDISEIGNFSGSSAIPLLPVVFNEKVEKLSFSNTKDDRPLLKKLYKKSIEEVFQESTNFLYSNKNWSTMQAQNLLDLIKFGYTPKIEYLDLSGNQLDSSFGILLNNALKNRQLEFLNLNGNWKIGDNGMEMIIPLILDIETVCLQGVVMSDKTITSLANALQSRILSDNTTTTTTGEVTKISNPTKLSKLYIGENRIHRHSAKGIIYLMEQCESLREIQCQGCPISNESPNTLNQMFGGLCVDYSRMTLSKPTRALPTDISFEETKETLSWRERIRSWRERIRWRLKSLKFRQS